MTALLSKQKLRSFLEKTGLLRLEQREKRVLGFGIVFLLCFFFLKILFFPYLDARKRLTRSLVEKRSNVVKIVKMQTEYRLLKDREKAIKDKVSERPPGFTLFSFLEEQAAKANVKRLLQYMKPSSTDKDGVEQESLVEMKLQMVSLGQLVGFLKLVESPKDMVVVKHISIQESGTNDALLDVVLQVATFVDKT